MLHLRAGNDINFMLKIFAVYQPVVVLTYFKATEIGSLKSRHAPKYFALRVLCQKTQSSDWVIPWGVHICMCVVNFKFKMFKDSFLKEIPLSLDKAELVGLN